MDKVFEQINLYKHDSDGLIFTSAEAGYHFGTCETMIKWKPPSENTVDFLLQVKKTVNGDEYYISIFNGSKGYQFESDFEFGSDLEKVKGQKLHGRIIECKYVPNWPHFWRFSRFRDDKPDANHISTFVKVKKSIQDNVTREKLLEIRQIIEKSWKERELVSKGSKRSSESLGNEQKSKDVPVDRYDKSSNQDKSADEKTEENPTGQETEQEETQNATKAALSEKELLSVDFD